VRRTKEFRPLRGSPRLAEVRGPERTELWTETVGSPPPAYGERWAERHGRTYRAFEPARSKLSAAIVRGWEGDLPVEGDRWLYLGAASGTTASHVADLVGPEGRVHAVERSLRPFARLVQLAERWPSLLPVLGDAREPRRYLPLVPQVDGVYADIAQPDQVEIVLANAALFLLGPGAPVLLALKTPSMGRDASAATHVRRAEEALAKVLDLERSVKLEPFHRGHYLVGGRARAELFREVAVAPVTPTRGRSPARRRP
jgi:fibrillarin-like pre-rRNA processing protein